MRASDEDGERARATRLSPSTLTNAAPTALRSTPHDRQRRVRKARRTAPWSASRPRRPRPRPAR
ncbi:hypothetical protein ACRAWD_16515 [Caulobacter segnis]